MQRRTFLTAVVGISTLLAAGGKKMLLSAKADSTPAALSFGYHLPLESEPHLRTFMQWPSRASIYGGQRALVAVRGKIALIAGAISRFEPVVILASPAHMQGAALALGADIEIWPIATDDLWCRDSGPTFLRSNDGKLAVAELNFNGWGNKQVHGNDSKIAGLVAQKLGLPVFSNAVTGEAGGVECDGAGTLLAHESSWINSNRNGGDKALVERQLLAALGAERMIWAPGITGADITDYHIDALARFIQPGQVLLQLPRRIDRADPWSLAAYETYAVLKQARDAAGRALDIVVVDEPDPARIRSAKRDFVASYANYYVCNGAVISAEFGDAAADAKAAQVLGQLYPGRQVLSLNIDAIGEAGGGIHCATKEQPEG